MEKATENERVDSVKTVKLRLQNLVTVCHTGNLYWQQYSQVVIESEIKETNHNFIKQITRSIL